MKITRFCNFWALLDFLLIGFGAYGSFCCFEEERVALLKVKVAFSSPDGSALSSWSEEEMDCCKWERVVCDNFSKRELQKLWLTNNTLKGFKGELRFNKLHSLILSVNNLTEIPYLGGVPSLKYLYLRRNSLENFSNLQELTALQNLETLALQFNQIRGIIPPIIGALTSLKALSFASNELNGPLSEEGFCQLRNIQALDLSLNGFEGTIPTCFCNLTSLRVLRLSWNNLTGAIPPTLFSSLTSLEYVSLKFNHFEGLVSFSSFADNSNLKVFELDSHNNMMMVDTENPPWTPLFQLKVLQISNCRLNEPSREIPSFLFSQHDLIYVDLSLNSMIGHTPAWLLVNNSGLGYLDLGYNFFTGTIVFHADYRNINMFRFDVSSNNIQGELPAFIGYIFPNLVHLNLTGNAFHGSIPPSMGNMRSLHSLDLSFNNFSGELPEHFITGCISLRILKASNNSLKGHLFSSKWNLTDLYQLLLDNNLFSGELSQGLLNSSLLMVLDLRNNSISGNFPDWIGEFPHLRSILLSGNYLNGPMPLSFSKLDKLISLDLSRNNLCSIHPSINLSSLMYLHLQGNELDGPLPSFISRLSSLVLLDVSNNNLSGEIPSWLGSVSNLRVLLLKGNNLEGPIPFHTCDLKNISMLDLSFNNLSGRLPPCLCSIQFGKKRLFDGSFSTQRYGWSMPGQLIYEYHSQLDIYRFFIPSAYDLDIREKVEFITKSRSESYVRNMLDFMSGIDLSHNKFTGPIPPQLGYLGGIQSMNLSHNHLNGSIPETFSGLKEIQCLDLSYNRLSGEIPTELIALNFLSAFSVAYNDLSGKTPQMKGQFATFEEQSYEGNDFLCGAPLPSCETSRLPRPPDQGLNDAFIEAFRQTFVGSYFVTFLSAVVFLYLNPFHPRHLFEFIEAKFKLSVTFL